MTEKNYLTASNLGKSDTIRRLIEEKTAHVLCFFPGNLPAAGELQSCVLVVTGGGPEHILSLLEDDHLPEYTPILYLGEGDCIPEFIENFGATRVIDYLPLPSSIPVFLHRIALLSHVQKTSAGHYAHRTTLSRQLNLLTTRGRPDRIVQQAPLYQPPDTDSFLDQTQQDLVKIFPNLIS